MEKRNEQKDDDYKKGNGLSAGLVCHLCTKMTPKEIYVRWGSNYEARYKETCKKHRPLMLKRMEDGLTKLKELLAD